ncbi:MAG: DNA methyltransferase [Blastocatellia bacterium AA13]|nr:MAG: DNA methyltransferase [Blastocatellia bacterium AA13]
MTLFDAAPQTQDSPHPRGANENNKLYAEDRAAHDWYRFVLSFPPHLVRQYVEKFGLDERHIVLDPFCGTGTTAVECKKLAIPSIGIEGNPMAKFASEVKLDWTPDPQGLMEHAQRIRTATLQALDANGVNDDPLPLFNSRKGTGLQSAKLRQLPIEKMKLLLNNSISPLPLHKVLVLIDQISINGDDRYNRHLLLALAKALVYSISNLQFGPEVGLGPIKQDAAVVAAWFANVTSIANDLVGLQRLKNASSFVHYGDARSLPTQVTGRGVDAVITSPPYPNEKDYTRTTRLESVLLGFVQDREGLQRLKRGLMRSNTRGVYKGDADDKWVSLNTEVQHIADTIEARRIQLEKTSGFEKLYARVTRLYFGGMARHLESLRAVLRPGAKLAYVVGDQASYLRVMIRTGDLLGRIAESLGYEIMGKDLFRTRLATATKEQLREEVLLLRWPSSQ